MKIRIVLRLFSACLIGALGAHSAFGQAPPVNDNFTNRIVLSGSEVTFPGTLAGATIESPVETNYISGAARSVWWEWTAPDTAVLNLQVANYSTSPGWQQDGLSIYQKSGTNALSIRSLGAPLATMYIGGVTNQTLALAVAAGTTYQVQLAGVTNYGNYRFRLFLTNCPIILVPPLSRTVIAYDGEVLFVEASGIEPLSYQWRHDGVDLPGETAPMLSLPNISTNQAGAYTVVVSNAWGTAESVPATLEVVPREPPDPAPPIPPLLYPISARSNSLTLTMMGTSHYQYMIQTSSNLVTWDDLQWVNYPTNLTIALSIPKSGARQFVRAKVITDPTIATNHARLCENNLREIRAAKILLRRSIGAYVRYTPSLSELRPFFPHSTEPLCPDDSLMWYFTSYTTGDSEFLPVCDVLPATHLLDYLEFR